MYNSRQTIGICAVVCIAALVVVGFASGEIARHMLQTLPLWPAAILGLSGSSWAKWTGLPVFLFWLAIMALIWAYLLHFSDIASGSYSPVETVLTVLTGMAALVGLIACHLDKGAGGIVALPVTLLMFAVQAGAMYFSLHAPFENDRMFLSGLFG